MAQNGKHGDATVLYFKSAKVVKSLLVSVHQETKRIPETKGCLDTNFLQSVLSKVVSKLVNIELLKKGIKYLKYYALIELHLTLSKDAILMDDFVIARPAGAKAATVAMRETSREILNIV